jgi:hypothetical protein
MPDRVNGHLCEEYRVKQWLKDLALQDALYVNLPAGAILESNV